MIKLRLPALLGLGSTLTGCAVPASRVAVPTESMQEALKQARDTQQADLTSEVPLRRVPRFPSPPGAPKPVLAPPDVRMAYFYEWVDSENNKHFGGWVGIPLTGYDWIMKDVPNPNIAHPGSDADIPASSR
jgi:hypothetical protein